MNTILHSSRRASLLRRTLLASAVTLGVAGAVGTGFVIGHSEEARAEAVRVEAPAPADFSTVVERVRPAVVSVQVKTEAEPVSQRGTFRGFEDLPEDSPFYEFFRRFGTPPGFDEEERGERPGARPNLPRRFGMSQGSGFFISEDGYLITNNHVVEGSEEFTILMDDGREFDAKLIGRDERTDLALLKVEGNGFTYVTLATEHPKVGQWALAVGNPFGLGGTVTAGIISAEGRDIGAGPYDNFLQIDAPVNRGNSGGPTFNTRGEVIGVNTAIFSPSGGNVGIAFAIPADTVSDVVDDLRSKGVVTRGWLGVQIQPVTADIAASLGVEETSGALVSDAQESGPAAAAGIESGDIITAVDGTTVKDPKELSQKIAGLEPDRSVKISVLRDGKEQDFDVTLGNLNELDKQTAAKASEPDAKPEPASVDSLGLTLEPNMDGDGVLVAGVADDSPASETGLAAGDVILSVGDRTVATVDDVQEGIDAAKESGREAVLLKVQSERGTRFIGVPFERG